MPKIINKRPNASHLVNGIAFALADSGHMISEESVEDEALELLLAIPGFEIHSETKEYADGTKATGPAPLPEQSPSEQEAKQPDPTPAVKAAAPAQAAPKAPAKKGAVKK